MPNKIEQILTCNSSNQTRSVESDLVLYTIVTKTINKNTLTVYTSNYEKATADSSKFIHFSITLNGASYTNYEKIFIKFRQSSLTPVDAKLYVSNSNYFISGMEYKYVHSCVEEGITYRYSDITSYVANNPNSTIYFAITTENNDSLDLYTESSSYDPILEVSYYIESDFYKKQAHKNIYLGSNICSVNVRTGKLNYINNLITTTSPKMPLNLSLHYNESFSHKSTITSTINTNLPYGFKLNYQQYLYKTGSRYYYVDEAFKTHTFELVDNYDELDSENTSEVYKEINGNYLILKIMDNYDAIETLKGDSFVFNKSGYLIAIESIYNTELVTTILYDSNNKISQITDGMGIKTKVVHYTESTTKKYIFFYYNTEVVTDTTLSNLLNNSTAYIESTSNQLTKVKDMTNVITTYEYDVVSNTPALRIIPTTSYNLLKRVSSLGKVIQITHNTTKKVSNIIEKVDNSANLEFNEYIFKYKGRTTEVDRKVNGNSNVYDTQIYKFNDEQEIEHSYTKRNNKIFNFQYNYKKDNNVRSLQIPVKYLGENFILYTVNSSEDDRMIEFFNINDEDNNNTHDEDLEYNMITTYVELKQQENSSDHHLYPDEIIGSIDFYEKTVTENNVLVERLISSTPIYHNYYDKQIIVNHYYNEFYDKLSEMNFVYYEVLNLNKSVEIYDRICIYSNTISGKEYIKNKNNNSIISESLINLEIDYNNYDSSTINSINTNELSLEDIRASLFGYNQDNNHYNFWFNDGKNLLYGINNAKVKKNNLQIFQMDSISLYSNSRDSKNINETEIEYNVSEDYNKFIVKTDKTTITNHNTTLTKTTRYNHIFDVIEEVLTSGVTKKYEYDNFGNVVKIDLIKDKTMNESKVSFNYNLNNQELYRVNKSIVNNIGENISTSIYDKITNLKSVTNYKNQLIGTYEYINNLLSKITHGTNGGETEFTYNNKGMLTSFKQGNDIYSIEYDDIDEIMYIKLNEFKLVDNTYDYRSDKVIVTSIINETDTYVNIYDLYGNLHETYKVIDGVSSKVMDIGRGSEDEFTQNVPNDKIYKVEYDQGGITKTINYSYIHNELVLVQHANSRAVEILPDSSFKNPLDGKIFTISQEKYKDINFNYPEDPGTTKMDILKASIEKTDENNNKTYWKESYVLINGDITLEYNGVNYVPNDFDFKYIEQFDSYGLKFQEQLFEAILNSGYMKNIEYYTKAINEIEYKTPNVKKEIHKLLDSQIIVSEYLYDENNNIISDNTTYNCNNNTVSLNEYQYDEFNRLIRENNKIRNETYVYTYDDKGNITNKKTYSYSSGTNGLGSLLANVDYLYHTHTDNNSKYNSYMLKSYAGKTVEYDSAHRISKISHGNDVTNYHWIGNKLIKIEYSLGDITKVEFEYNSLGERTLKRITKSDGMVINHEYLYYNGRLLKEIITSSPDSVNTGTITYLYANDKLVGFRLLGFLVVNVFAKNYYYIYNNRNEIIGIQDDENVVVLYDYDAWGKVQTYAPSGEVNNSELFIGNINPYKYKGYYYDVETGLFMMGHRYYSPELCRFIQPDDIEYLDPQSINGLNLYAYCGNDPVNKYDPTGHFGISALIIGAVIGFVTTGIKDYVKDGKLFNGDISGWEYFGSTFGGAIGGLGAGLGTTILASGVGNVIEAAFAGEISSFGDVMIQFALGGVLGGVGYGISKGITSIFADRKIFGVLGNLTDNTKVNKRLAKAGFGHLKIGKHGLHNVYNEMYEAYGFNTMKDAISSVYDFAVGLAF